MWLVQDAGTAIYIIISTILQNVDGPMKFIILTNLLTSQIFLTMLRKFKKKCGVNVGGNEDERKSKMVRSGKKVEGLNKIFKAIAEILEREKGLRPLFRTTYRTIREVVPIQTPITQWEALLGKLERSEELIEGENILSRLYSSLKNENKTIRRRAYVKLIRRIARRFLRSETLKQYSLYIDHK
ncbi:hypothetical protein PMAYCL1PPCAC_28929 [Pristionchus mayeri]|uniref:Uncharacterized protein n=1 Tax=Pristionchus mayeri TaxID=1317129 RepID=A0AAN5DB55_9BILA|nr:hypothetical protein PMAYCL1PPCAC_28929 [Pristionchus mayeri]